MVGVDVGLRKGFDVDADLVKAKSYQLHTISIQFRTGTNKENPTV